MTPMNPLCCCSGRVPIIAKDLTPYFKQMDSIFDLSSIPRVDSYLCPCYDFVERHLQYNVGVEVLGQPGHESYEARTIVLHGYYHSWRYMRAMDASFR